MNAGHHGSRDKPKKVSSGGGDANIKQSQVAEHVADLILPIRNLSEAADLTYLTYLLDMARAEAQQLKGKD